MHLAGEVRSNLAADVRAVVRQKLPKVGGLPSLQMQGARSKPADRPKDGRVALDDDVVDTRVGVGGVKHLHAKIGELTLANDFLAGALGKAGLLASARR